MERHFLRSAGVTSLLICLSVFITSAARAQESPSAEATRKWGGNLDLGYRFTKIDGENRYREAVNLMEGLRLFDFGLWFRDPAGKGWADNARLRINQVGDPFPSGRFEIKKSRTYQVTADYRESNFYFNREDTGILTDNHDFDQKRRRVGVTLALFPDAGIPHQSGRHFAQREGEARVPRVFTSVPNLAQDLHERFNEYFASADFPLGAGNSMSSSPTGLLKTRTRSTSLPPRLRAATKLYGPMSAR